MLIVDGQVHIWGADSPERTWPSEARGLEHREVPLGAAELLDEMDRAGVTRAVLVPPSWEGDRNDLALQAAADHPDRFAVMGRLDVREVNPARVLGWRTQPGMLGVRLTFHRPPQRGWLTDGTADWFWSAAEAARLPVMVYAPGQAEALGEVATRHPDLPLIVDHLGLGLEVQDQGLGPAIAPVLDLADRPNVAVKVSALPCYVSEPFPFRSLRPHVQQTIEAFGAVTVLLGIGPLTAALPIWRLGAIRHRGREPRLRGRPRAVHGPSPGPVAELADGARLARRRSDGSVGTVAL